MSAGGLSRRKAANFGLQQAQQLLADKDGGTAAGGHRDQAFAEKGQQAAGVATPAPMQAVWDWEHKKMVDTTARIKTMLSMFRGA